MARNKVFKQVSSLEVHLWGTHVGSLAWEPAKQCYAFRFTPAFRQLGIDPAPLKMPVARDTIWTFDDLGRATYQGLPAMISDSLPDAFGNRLIEATLLDYGLDQGAITPLDRLAYIGSRAMGAFRFKPSRGPSEKATAIDLRNLVDEARQAISTQPGGTEATTLQHIIQVGISAGGARPKAVVCWNPKTNTFRSGQFDAPAGFEHWLLKFDGIEKGQIDANEPRNEGRVEYAYHLMARAAGLEMSDCRLHEEGGRAHFMTRRFDREGASTRHHIQTLCAMAHMDLKHAGAHSYTQLFDTLASLHLPDSSFQETFRRMAFNVMARNMDDHTKNHSFRLKERGNWELSPAYDLTYAHNPNGNWNHQHFLAVNRKHDNITRPDLLVDAERFSIADRKSILDQVASAVGRWPEFAAQAGVPSDQAEEIRQDLRPL